MGLFVRFWLMSSHITYAKYSAETGSQTPHEQVDRTETVARKTGADAKMSNAAQMGKEESAFMQEGKAADVWRGGRGNANCR